MSQSEASRNLIEFLEGAKEHYVMSEKSLKLYRIKRHLRNGIKALDSSIKYHLSLKEIFTYFSVTQKQVAIALDLPYSTFRGKLFTNSFTNQEMKKIYEYLIFIS